MIEIKKDEYFKTIRLKLYPTEEQKEQMLLYNEITRRVYNWGITMEERNYELYKEGKVEYAVLTKYDFQRICTAFKKTDDPFVNILTSVPSTTALNELSHVSEAFKNFLDGRTHYPSFHKVNTSFTTRFDRSYITDGHLHIEGFTENILLKTHRYDGYSGCIGLRGTSKKFYNVSIHHNGIYFYVYFSIVEKKDFTRLANVPIGEPVGIDLGIRQTFTLSNGQIYMQPDITRYKNRIKELSKLISKVGDDINLVNSDGSINERLSKNIRKKIIQRKKDYERIHNVLFSFYYKTVNRIIMSNPEAIVIETINKSRIKQFNPFNKALQDTYFYSIRIIIENLCNKYNIPLYEVNEYYPSTKKCNKCGKINDICVGKIYRCNYCGFTIDRDLNASYNLRDVYINNETENIKSSFNIKGSTNI